MSAADRLLRQLRERPSTADRATDVYIGVLAVLVFVLPLARWATQQLAPAMQWRIDALHVVGALAACAVAAVAAGRTRGPVAPTAPYVDWVVAGPVELGRQLRPAWRRGLFSVVVLALLAAAVAVVSRDSWPDPIATVVFLAVAVAVGAVLGVAWLAGQARLRVVGALLVLVVAAVGWPMRAAWLALDEGPSWWVLVVPALAVVALVPARRMLDALRPARLRTQALRWSQVQSFAITADLASAADVLRGRTRRGRGWRPHFRAPALVRRDLVGLVRSPGRTAAGVVLAAVSGMLLGPAGTAPTPLIAIVAVALSYAAASYLSDGLRFHAVNRSRPALLGLPPSRITLQHLVVPGVLLLVVMTAAGTATGAALQAVGLALLALACRAASAFKGLLPLEYLTPIMTPVGEVSSLRVGLWVADAFLVCTIVGATIVFQAEAVAALGLLVAAAALVGVWAHSRWSR